MTDDMNIEEMLKRYRSTPGARVKRSVLARFTHTFGNRVSDGNSIRFWQKPIPLYVAVVMVIIAVGLSFLAGQRTPPQERRLESRHASPWDTGPATTQELTWEVAQRDLL